MAATNSSAKGKAKSNTNVNTSEKYVAYVSTYTRGDKHGIKIYDVDMDKGRFIEKDQVEVTNSSYVTISHNKKYLYSITDFGVEAYKILEDGGLKMISLATINGMRGCYLSTDYTDSYLFVAGYHDGKLTVLRLNENGGVGEITDEIFHKGLGTVAERNFRPHINCARMTHDNKYLLVADQGMDHVNVYRLDLVNGKVHLADVIRSEMESAPRHIKISRDGRFIYIVHEWKCFIDVYSYEEKGDQPVFEKIQTIETVKREKGSSNAASALTFSEDHKYLISTNAGNNSATLYSVDEETGKLTTIFCLPVSGDYPKDASLFPNNKFLVSLNHESNEMTFFHVDPKNGTLIMNGPPIQVNVPNCITFHKLS
ncbi:MAG: beta-propeller fold lactonase family protein [Acetatifactor sp.]|nr:beta-propeller fold lactonase family protein [Acetatifactor sp.]